MMETILYLYDKCAALVAKQVPVSRLLATGLFDELVQMKYTVPNDDLRRWTSCKKQSTPSWPPWPRADEEGTT